MAKSKSAKAPAVKGGYYTVRLERSYRIALEELARKSRRTETAELRIALEERFASNGITFPPKKQS